MTEDESTTTEPASSLQDAPQVRPEGRSARIARDVLQATIQILIETGGKDLSIERIAEKANVNRATIYRRWKSKERLMAWAMLELMGKAVAQPDEGNIEDDLVAMAMRLSALEGSPLGAAMMQIIAVESKRDEAVREAIGTYWETRFRLAHKMIDRAIDRGELRPDVDKDFLIDAVYGPLYYRYFRDAEALTPEIARKFVNQALAGHRTEPEPGD